MALSLGNFSFSELNTPATLLKIEANKFVIGKKVSPRLEPRFLHACVTLSIPLFVVFSFVCSSRCIDPVASSECAILIFALRASIFVTSPAISSLKFPPTRS